MTDNRTEASKTIRGSFVHFIRGAVEQDFALTVAETLGAKIFMVALGLATSVIVARILGPGGRGMYAAAAAVGAIGVQLGNLGLHSSNTYFVARDRSFLPILAGNSLAVSVALGGLVAVAAGGVFVLTPELAPVRGPLLALALAYIPLGLAFLLTQNLLVGLNELGSFNRIEVGNKVLAILLIGAAIALGSVSPVHMFGAGVFALAAGCIASFRKLAVFFEEPVRISVPLFRQNISYGLRAYAAALFSFLVLRFDVLMVQYMLGAEQTGYYSIAVAMADLIYLFPVTVGTVLFPKLSAMKEEEERWKCVKGVAWTTGLSLAAVASAAAVLSRPVVFLLYGEAFLPAVPAFLWLLPGILLLSVNTIFMNYFASVGMPPVAVYAPAAAATANILLNLALIPAFGIRGASLSSVIAYGMMLGASVIFLKRRGPKVPA